MKTLRYQVLFEGTIFQADNETKQDLEDALRRSFSVDLEAGIRMRTRSINVFEREEGDSDVGANNNG